MKHSNSSIILPLIFAAVLFVLGWLTFGKLFEVMLPGVHNAHYVNTEFSGQLKTSLLFSTALALTPILVFLIWKYLPISSNKEKLLSLLIVIGTMTLSIVVRREMVKSNFAKMSVSFDKNVDIPMITYPVDKIHFEYYLLAGLIAGCIISYLAFKPKRLNP